VQDLPGHVVEQRRDGRRYILLHRSVAVLEGDKVEVKRARSTIILPLVGLGLSAITGSLLVSRGSGLGLWALVLLLLFCLLVVPISVMGLVSSFVGASVVVDRKKGSVTWQQGALGMGIGARDVVPFDRIDHLEVTIEGDQPDRWQGETDSLRQFALVLVKDNAKRLEVARVPVPPSAQADGMDRTLALANAIAGLAGTTVHIPEGWELVTIDTETGEVKAPRAGKSKRRSGR